jgi:hypothetical protein
VSANSGHPGAIAGNAGDRGRLHRGTGQEFFGHAGPHGRDSHGRFGLGNPGGPGNPPGKKAAQLRAALIAAVSKNDIRGIAERLIRGPRPGTSTAVAREEPISRRECSMSVRLGDTIARVSKGPLDPRWRTPTATWASVVLRLIEVGDLAERLGGSSGGGGGLRPTGPTVGL